MWLAAIAVIVAAVGAAFVGGATADEGAPREAPTEEPSSPLSSGWVTEHQPATGWTNAAVASPAGRAPEVTHATEGTQPRTWCLGNDNEADAPGDPGPDLITVASTGACRPDGSSFDISLVTRSEPDVVELLVDTDANADTGCNGFDLAYVNFTGFEFSQWVGRRGVFEVPMPSCDRDAWSFEQATGVGIAGNSGMSLRIELMRGSRWIIAVANIDGSGYDEAWTSFYVSTVEIECGANRVTAYEAADGYRLIGIDGSMWAFGSVTLDRHACLTGLGRNRIVDFEYVPVGGADPDGWVAIRASGSLARSKGTGRVSAPPPWSVGAIEVVAVMPIVEGDVWGGKMWVVYDNGAVRGLATDGAAPLNHGDLAHLQLAGPIIDAVIAPDGLGYWLVGTDGGVFSFGSARFAGSMGAVALNQPVVAMVADPDGAGYWLVAADGGVFAFDAPYVGSVPAALPAGRRLNRPIVGMAPYGNGYLMFAADGGVFNFSDRSFAGSLGDSPPAVPIVGVAVSPRRA